MTKKMLSCCVCHCEVPKSQVQFVDEDTFSYLKNPPAGIAAGAYCVACFDGNVREQLDSYNMKIEKAKNINVFYLSQSKESQFIRRTEKPLEVKDVVDRDEALLRLAFLAVEANKNTLVDVEFHSTKIRNGRWQTSRWAARGIPSNCDEANLRRRVIT